MNLRVVFDTNTVLSALLFPNGRVARLRRYWSGGRCTPLTSAETALELARVLAYPKFRLSPDERHELLADYLPYCEIVDVTEPCWVTCRDVKDQAVLDLAQSAKAGVLVSGDLDLLVLHGQTSFAIESPQLFASRVLDG